MAQALLSSELLTQHSELTIQNFPDCLVLQAISYQLFSPLRDTL